MVSSIKLKPGRLLCLLLTVFGCLLLAHCMTLVLLFGFGHDVAKGFIPMFNFDGEQNVPAFFSVVLLLMAASLLAIIFGLNAQRNATFLVQWKLLIIGFLLMAFDEGFSFHEKLTEPVREFLLHGHRAGFLYFAWIVPGLALISLLSLVFIRFLIHLPRRTSRLFVVSAMVYLGGAIGLEAAGGYYAESLGSYQSVSYALIETFEESFEMLGVIIFIYSLLDYLRHNFPDLKIDFGNHH